MVSTNPSQAQRRTQAQAPRAAQANAAQQIPATNFGRHFAIADGDCVFRVLHMDLTNRPGVQASNEQVMELRQAAANYVTEHRQALIAHPSFGGEAGVNDLYDLLMTPRQWNEDAGDMVAPILARVLGRELRILQPAQQAGVYEMNDNRIFRPQDPVLPPGRPDTGQPPIHLLHTGSGTHYEYLESRSTQADATAGSVHTHTRPVAHSVDDLGAPPSAQASPLGRASPSLWLEEFMRGQKNNPAPGNLSRGSSSGSMSPGNISLDSQSSIKLLKELDREHGNSGPSGSVPRSPSFGSISSGNMSLASMSSRKLLDKLTPEEENGPVAQPPRKRRRKAGARTEQQDITAEHRSQPPLRKRQVYTQAARTEISNAFAQANKGAFETLTEDEQNAEVARISRETGYNLPSVRITLTGGGTMRVRSQKARTEISNAFTQANSRSFGALMQDEQDTEVRRISRETGYNLLGVRTTLISVGNKEVTSQKARNQINNEFTQSNHRAFGALTQDEQSAEVARISRVTGYIKSGVRTTLAGGGNKQVQTQAARTEISNTFIQMNDRAFSALTQAEQTANVARISSETGYRPSGIWDTLSGVGKKRVESVPARTQIIKLFTDAVNNRTFEALTQDEQDAEVTRISRETGYNPSGVRTMLTSGGIIKVQSQAARTEISNVFAQANNRAFETLTQDEQDTEVARISRETGYRASGVRKTLTDTRFQSQAARTQIMNAFTQANDRAFEALTQDQQYNEVLRICQETGHSRLEVLITLIGEINRQVEG